MSHLRLRTVQSALNGAEIATPPKNKGGGSQ